MEYFRAKFSQVVTFKIFYTARQDISVNQKLRHVLGFLPSYLSGGDLLSRYFAVFGGKFQILKLVHCNYYLLWVLDLTRKQKLVYVIRCI